uniref:Uncharacterized protein n=1 Tax=Arundo donax TaxID=35708 RepID=A0A0A9B3I4_ARUDO
MEAERELLHTRGAEGDELQEQGDGALVTERR